MPTSQRIADTNRRSCRIATVAPLAVLLTVLVLVGTAMFDTYEHSPAPSQHAAGHALSHSASRHCIIGKELHIRTNRTDSTTNKDYVVRLVENQASAQSSSRFFRYSNRMADAPKAVGSKNEGMQEKCMQKKAPYQTINPSQYVYTLKNKKIEKRNSHAHVP